MKRAARLILLTMLAVVAAGVLPVSAASPHENPDTAPFVFDGAAVLGKYSEALDAVLQKDSAAVESLQGQVPLANIPTDLRDTVDMFLSSGRSLAQIVFQITAKLDKSRELMGQFRPDDAQKAAEGMQEDLAEARSHLGVMEDKAQRTGQRWRVDSATQGSALRLAYSEVMYRLARVRALLDLLGEISQSTGLQIGKLTGEGLTLRPTSLTLRVEPGAAFVGDTVSVQGTLRSGATNLVGKQVTILLDGSPAMVVSTSNGGGYRGRIQLPYRYVPEMNLQAIYYPRGNDIGTYLGSSSPEVAISVLYFNTQLTLDVPQGGNPGRNLKVNGLLYYGHNMVPESRNVSIYWDGALFGEMTTRETFSVDLPLPADTSLARHQLMFSVSPQGKYAPTQASAEVEVSKIVPTIVMDTPTAVLLPLTQYITGRIYSPLGPLQDTAVTAALGDWETSSPTSDDGSFRLSLRTGLVLSLVGTQKLVVTASPSEPWHESASASASLLVVNFAGISLVFFLLMAAAAFGAVRLRKRPLPAVQPVAVTPVAVAAADVSAPEPIVPEAQGTRSHRDVMLGLYRRTLQFVQRVTSVVLRPSHTLREYADDCAPRLGPLGGRFREFTLMIERLLYSRHGAAEPEVLRAGDLNKGFTDREDGGRENT
ncbi:MAG: DUF4129 domain-containing protein [Chloroflexi bacterium]|nr:DUF4129 domain-containing protein [Chloroflexota bacterium]